MNENEVKVLSHRHASSEKLSKKLGMAVEEIKAIRLKWKGKNPLDRYGYRTITFDDWITELKNNGRK